MTHPLVAELRERQARKLHRARAWKARRPADNRPRGIVEAVRTRSKPGGHPPARLSSPEAKNSKRCRPGRWV